MMSMTERQLLNLKSDIEKSKITEAELNGKRDTYKEQLNSKWKCKTVTLGKTKREEIASNIEDLKEQLKEGIEQLELDMQND